MCSVCVALHHDRTTPHNTRLESSHHSFTDSYYSYYSHYSLFHTQVMIYDLHTLGNRFYFGGHALASLHTTLPLICSEIRSRNCPVDCIAFPDVRGAETHTLFGPEAHTHTHILTHCLDPRPHCYFLIPAPCPHCLET